VERYGRWKNTVIPRQSRSPGRKLWIIGGELKL
jgi:hypothetical protein